MGLSVLGRVAVATGEGQILAEASTQLDVDRHAGAALESAGAVAVSGLACRELKTRCLPYTIVMIDSLRTS